MSPYDMNPLDDEQERKRREEIAAMAENEPMGRGAVEPSFFESVGQGISNRFNNAITQAGNTLMNPQQAIQQKMMNEQTQQRQQDQANTEVQTNTTTTYGDGSKEHTVKTQVPAGQPQPQPQQQQAPMGPTISTGIPSKLCSTTGRTGRRCSWSKFSTGWCSSTGNTIHSHSRAYE